MRGIKAFLPFMLWMISSGVSAQKVWTLQECVDHALKNNIQVKQAELNTELADVSKDQSLATMLPSLNGGASHSYFFGRSVDPTTYQFTTNEIRSSNFSLTSSLAIFEGFQLQNSLKQSKLNYMSSKFDLQKIRNDISLNVVTFYLQVLFNKDLVAQAKVQSDAGKVQRDRMIEMEKAGAVSRGNLLDMEAQFATDELGLVNAQSQYDAAVLSLAQLLELESVSGFSVDTLSFPVPFVDYSALNVSSIYETALTTQPDVKSSEYKVESASKGLSIARGASYPRLTLSGSMSSAYSSSGQRPVFPWDTIAYESGFTQSERVYSYGLIPVYEKTSFRDQLDENLSKSIGINLVIPLFNGLQTRSGIRRAKIYLQQAQLNNESVRKSIFKSVQQAVNDVASANNRFSAAQKSAAALSESYNFNQQRFDLGMLNTYDFLVSKNNYTKAQAEMLQAKYDLIFKLKILDFYMGKPLTF
ncbi:MAG: TolC family protein [Bacteroidia bacterium]|nr:TolC family protein [Bacteroidia bacterium]